MKSQLFIFGFLVLFSSPAFSQSGRRVKEARPPTPAVEEPSPDTEVKAAKQDETPAVTAEKNQDYRCTEDGSLARILDPAGETELIVSVKEVDTRAVINSKPRPSYTKEARRNGVQGYVILRVVLSSTGKISRVRVLRGVPFGLTESAIRAACKLDFKPAMKDGKPVSQWLTVEYAFRLADSSIFGP